MAKEYLDKNGLAYFWSKLKTYLATPSRAGLMSPTDKAKVDAITNQGTVAYYKKLEGSYTTTSSPTTTIPIPIESYSTADILLVDINGLDLVGGTDYTVSGTNIVLTTPIMDVGQIVHFIDVRATTATVSDYSMLKGDAGVVDAYPRSGATPLSAGWLSETSGGSALTPESNQIYILMADSGDYTANAMFRWNGSAYVPLTSGGSVTSTSVPTANTISEFDSTAHMNSEDMTAQEVQDFVDNLEGGGGGGRNQLTRVVCTNNSKLTYGNCYGWYDPTTKSVRLSCTWSATQNITTNDVIFTIPAGFRPIEDTAFPQTTVTDTGGFNCYHGTVYPSGEVHVNGTNYGRYGWGYIEYRCWKQGE